MPPNPAPSEDDDIDADWPRARSAIDTPQVSAAVDGSEFKCFECGALLVGPHCAVCANSAEWARLVERDLTLPVRQQWRPMDYDIIADIISHLSLKRTKKEQIVFAFCKRLSSEFANFDNARFMHAALSAAEAPSDVSEKE